MMMEEATVTKIIVTFLLWSIKFVCGVAPLLFRGRLRAPDRGWWTKKLIGGVLCAGGGMLLSTVFLHMLPEVRDSIKKAVEKRLLSEKADEKYHLGELLICTGFLLILVVENIAHKIADHKSKTELKTQDNQGEDDENEKMGDTPAGMKLKISGISGQGDVHGNNNCQDDHLTISVPTPSLKPPPSVSPCFSSKKFALKNVNPLSRERLSSYNSSTDCTAVRETNDDKKKARAKREMLSGLRTFLMILGFSVHNLFEGMAVGLEECRRGVWQLFAAIIVHSAAIMFTIGTDLVISGTALWRMVAYMMMVSAVTPAGVIVGLLSTSAHSSQPLLVGAMQGLAAGTLVYITFFEVLSRDRLTKYGMSGLLGTVIVILAFAGMAAVSSIGGGHSHGLPGHAHQVQDSHHHQGDVKQLFGENLNLFHSRVNEESDSDLNHGEHDVVFDYENFHHGDHEHGQHHHHA